MLGTDPAELNALLVSRGVPVIELREQRRTLEESVLALTEPGAGPRPSGAAR